MAEKILILVNGSFDNQIEFLKCLGFGIDQKVLRDCIDIEKMINKVSGYDYIITGGEIWTEKILDRLAGSLKMLIKFGVGVDTIDIVAAHKNGIAVSNTPGRNARAVAEHSLALMISAARNIPGYDKQMKNGCWHVIKTASLIGKTVGLLGFGNIAQELAKLLRGFTVKLIAFDILMDRGKALELGVESTSVEELYSQADFLSIHLPLTTETKGMINLSSINKMKNTAWIVNTSRGGIINEQDLVYALKNDLIRGAAMDVFEHEPLAFGSELTKLSNVVLTPHAASITDEAFRQMMDCCVDNILSYSRGLGCCNLVK